MNEAETRVEHIGSAAGSYALGRGGCSAECGQHLLLAQAMICACKPHALPGVDIGAIRNLVAGFQLYQGVAA